MPSFVAEALKANAEAAEERRRLSSAGVAAFVPRRPSSAKSMAVPQPAPRSGDDGTEQLDELLRRAAEKFAELDSDGSGYLEGDELIKLGTWVWHSVKFDGEPLPADKALEIGSRVLKGDDGDGDGRMSFVEFEAWFRRAGASLEARREKHRFEKLLPAARQAFQRLDADGSGQLESYELRDLGRYTWKLWNGVRPRSAPVLQEPDFDEWGLAALAQYDANGDGKMSFDEFVTFFEETTRGLAQARWQLKHEDQGRAKAVTPAFHHRLSEAAADADVVVEGGETC